ncbi:MAG: hypothetical protein CMM94_03795 [Rickettsiales bacterium]|nr:hypothetical protein [Rickettsiales bacterium]
MPLTSHKHGFSLVELSIVLVILGLLAGSIVIGQNLIHGAEINRTISQTQQYVSATNAFREKYNALPGDMRNATDYWGAAGGGGTGAACFTTESFGEATCNGDGDGRIHTPAGGTGVWANGETFHAWKHLANAGLIEGAYSGVSNDSSDFEVNGGYNVPSHALSEIGNFIFFYIGYIDAGDGWYFPGNYKNTLVIAGSVLGGGTRHGRHAAISTKEAYNIDRKIDDSFPSTGQLRAPINSRRGNCADSDAPADAEYQIDNDLEEACFVVYMLGY